MGTTRMARRFKCGSRARLPHQGVWAVVGRMVAVALLVGVADLQEAHRRAVAHMALPPVHRHGAVAPLPLITDLRMVTDLLLDTMGVPRLLTGVGEDHRPLTGVGEAPRPREHMEALRRRVTPMAGMGHTASHLRTMAMARDRRHRAEVTDMVRATVSSSRHGVSTDRIRDGAGIMVMVVPRRHSSSKASSSRRNRHRRESILNMLPS